MDTIFKMRKQLYNRPLYSLLSYFLHVITSVRPTYSMVPSYQFFFTSYSLSYPIDCLNYLEVGGEHDDAGDHEAKEVDVDDVCYLKELRYCDI